MPLTLTQAHAMTMVVAWMVFGSTGILFARYGRSLRCGARRQLLGKAVWFQIHRLLLSITPLLTLLDFLLILVRRGGQWTNPQTSDVRAFMHSVFGGIIVCCCILQIWLALYRCHPQSRFRYIFDWSHRLVGLLALFLFFPTMFLIVIMLSNLRPNLLATFSGWTVWTAIVIIILEKIQHAQRIAVLPSESISRTGNPNGSSSHTNLRQNTEAGAQVNGENRYYNLVKILLLFIHTIISTLLSVLLVVFLCI